MCRQGLDGVQVGFQAGCRHGLGRLITVRTPVLWVLCVARVFLQRVAVECQRSSKGRKCVAAKSETKMCQPGSPSCVPPSSQRKLFDKGCFSKKFTTRMGIYYTNVKEIYETNTFTSMIEAFSEFQLHKPFLIGFL